MLNCDVSPNLQSMSNYTHRIGRTGRAGRKGTSILFLTPKEADETLTALKSDCRRRTGRELLPYPSVDSSTVAEFMYRCNDVLTSLTKKKIKRAHLRDVAVEMLNCEKLQSHFQRNQGDQSALSHLVETSKGASARAAALTCVPFYMASNEMFPQPMAQLPASGSGSTGEGFAKPKRRRGSTKDPIEHLRNKIRKK